MTTDEASAALSSVRYTLLIIGTKGEKGPHFMIANWGVQASFDPWRYVLLLESDSHTLAYVKKTGAFTVNLLGEDQGKLAKEVLKKKGEGLTGGPGPLSAPRFSDAKWGIDCKVIQTLDIGGDHTLVVADIVDGWGPKKGAALTLGEVKLSYAG
ncbi:MAG: flavin reductase family protein [Thermoplasmatota archaeon]